MLDFAEITINDKELFEQYLMFDNPQGSDISFTNLFMWRNYYKFRYTIIEGLLCIISVPEGREPYALAPIGKINEYNFASTITSLREYFLNAGWKFIFKKVEEKKIAYFKKYVQDEEDMIQDRDNCDYVYKSEDLIYLKGKKYDGKRNHINKFKKLYQYEYVPITEENIKGCYEIMGKWNKERSSEEHKEYDSENSANSELIINYGTMSCKGAFIKVDGKFEAFTIGEMLNNDTVVIHIEKANSGINGLYTFINQQFCEHEWKEAIFINREQDLGVEGLRKAKLSYNPVKLINKYTIILKEEK